MCISPDNAVGTHTFLNEKLLLCSCMTLTEIGGGKQQVHVKRHCISDPTMNKIHCCCTFIHLRTTQFPWHTAGPQHLLSLQLEGKNPYLSFLICIHPFQHLPAVSVKLICCSEDPRWRMGHRLPRGSDHVLPLFQSPTHSLYQLW